MLNSAQYHLTFNPASEICRCHRRLSEFGGNVRLKTYKTLDIEDSQKYWSYLDYKKCNVNEEMFSFLIRGTTDSPQRMSSTLRRLMDPGLPNGCELGGGSG
ncbi:hypothetical protein J6590_076714 [Homalodisca vitripennis]|nr:hypothetical protein J6590_076714 [Homalodisca vitripennis]